MSMNIDREKRNRRIIDESSLQNIEDNNKKDTKDTNI